MLNYVDTRYGSNSIPSLSKGNTLPYTGVPFGNHYLAIQTQSDETSWWFNPYSTSFQGFRITHQPSPWMGDYAHFLITPYTKDSKVSESQNLASSYDLTKAKFKPYETSLTINRFQIKSSATMGQHVLKIRSESKHKISYKIHAQSGFKLINIDDNYIYFEVSNFSGCEDPNFKLYGIIKNDNYTISPKHSEFMLLDTLKENTVLTLALSFISFDQAILNLKVSDKSYDEFLNDNKNEWSHYFNKFNIEHNNSKELDLFSNMLYRCFLFPMRFYERDKDNKPYHYNTTSRRVEAGILYTNNGFWDTYKTVYPLFSLVAQEMFEEMLEGFLNSYRNSGYLPKWLSPDERGLMPGTLIDAVIADAASKDIGLDLMPELLDAMLKSATQQSDNPNYGRRLTDSYMKLGYVPNTVHESVNQTLDNAYSDYCISVVASKCNKDEVKNNYEKLSKNYENLFDDKTGFMRGKNEEGNFKSDFNPLEWGNDYTEGCAWQNSFGVYHDIQGLINLYPSNDAFLEKINQLVNQKPDFHVGSYGFEIHEITELAVQNFGQMAISNQPSFHIPYLFTYAKNPQSTQLLIKQLMKTCFSPSFEAYPGDEDNGSMSAWYVLNALGFYPVTPGSGEYVLGIPLLDKATISLSSGKELIVETFENYDHKNFVIERKINNEPYTSTFVKHDDIMKGITIESTLGTLPHFNKPKNSELPFSLSKEKQT